jgi:hypothetical protein
VASVRAIHIRVNWSAAVIFVLVAAGLAAWQFPPTRRRRVRLTHAPEGMLNPRVFLASLLAPEVAYGLVARHYGLRVNSIIVPSGHHWWTASARHGLDDGSIMIDDK